jgi:hypothetical protein
MPESESAQSGSQWAAGWGLCMQPPGAGRGNLGCAVSAPDFHHADPGRETEKLKI